MPRHDLGVVAALVVVAFFTCGHDDVDVRQGNGDAYGEAKLRSAIAQFSARGQTAQAFGELTREVFALYPRMDNHLALRAERELVFLAQAPLIAEDLSSPSQALVLGVWPFAFSDLLTKRRRPDRPDPANQFLPRHGETGAQYIERICEVALAGTCRNAVPEYAPHILATYAITRLRARAQIAAASCTTCAASSYADQLMRYAEMESARLGNLARLTEHADPANWLIAGSRAVAPQATLQVRLVDRGVVEVAEKEIPVAQLRHVLAGNTQPVGVWCHTQQTIEDLQPLLGVLRASNLRTFDLLVREPRYPWKLRRYPVDTDMPALTAKRKLPFLLLALESQE